MQYGTKGEGRDGATGGLPNGGEGGQAAEAAAETTSAERDSRTLDYLITVIGFGLCRAWIVFCLGAPLIAGAASSFTWAYLLFGALSALTVSFVANRSGKREGVVRVALFRATPVALAASGIIIPVALALNSEALMIVGFVAGGLGAGPLQVLWGDRFARHATLFAAVASPAAAIVTALVAGSGLASADAQAFTVDYVIAFRSLAYAFACFTGGVTLKAALAQRAFSTRGPNNTGVALTYMFTALLKLFFGWRAAYRTPKPLAPSAPRA